MKLNLHRCSCLLKKREKTTWIFKLYIILLYAKVAQVMTRSLCPWSSLLQVCFSYASSLLHLCFKYASSLLLVCFNYKSCTLQVCFKFTLSMLQIFFNYASSMLQGWSIEFPILKILQFSRVNALVIINDLGSL